MAFPFVVFVLCNKEVYERTNEKFKLHLFKFKFVQFIF